MLERGQHLSRREEPMSALEQSFRFAGFALAHAAWIASDQLPGELICPIAIITKGDERKVIPFEADTQIDAINAGKGSFEDLKHTVDSWALVREGYYSVADGSPSRRDVLAVSSWVKGLDEPVLLQQLFSPTSKGRFRLIGGLILTVHGVQLQKDAYDRMSAFVIQGIHQHPHGQRWTEWSIGAIQ